MPADERRGPLVVARLRAGVPDATRGMDRLDGPWRQVAERLAAVGQPARPDALRQCLSELEGGNAMRAAILAANPHDDPLAEPVAETIRQRHALRSAADIEAMPEPEYLIAGHIVAGSFALLFGQTGSMKTFEGLELAGCLASGARWHGLEETRQGTVVYVAAEGAGGLGKRIAAWRREHPNADLSRLYFVTEPVNLMDPADVEAFLGVLRALPEPPIAVIWDTLARCMVGADENSSRDMGIAIASLDRVRQEFGSTVIPIHHTGKNGEDERGSSALRAAADTVIKMVGDGATTTLSCVKQKDAEEFKSLTLRLAPIEGTGSCVLEYADYRVATELRPKARELLAVLDSHFTDEGAGTTAWKAASRQPDNTFYSCRRDLIRLGYVAHDGKPGGRHTLTPLGRSELGLAEAPPATATTTVLPSSYHGSNPESGGLLPTTTAAHKGGSGGSSPDGAHRPSGRPGNGRYNTVLNEPENLPWP